MSTDMPALTARAGYVGIFAKRSTDPGCGQTCPMNGGGGVLESSTCVFLVDKSAHVDGPWVQPWQVGTLPHQLPTWFFPEPRNCLRTDYLA